MKKMYAVLAAILALTMALSGCAVSNLPAADPLAQPAGNAPAITAEDAKTMIFEQLGISEADVRNSELDFDDGVYELSFDVGNLEYDVKVDPATGEILRVEKEVEDDVPPTQTPAAPAAITMEEAKAIVFAYLGITEADVRDLDLDHDDGVYELSFDVGNLEYDVKVDPATGEILRVEKEVEDDVPPTQTPAAITVEEAKAIVFAYLGITEADVRDLDLDHDDGVYELSFDVGNLEYDVKVSPDGKILEIEKEIDD